MVQESESSWLAMVSTAMSAWSGSSSYRLWLPTLTPNLLADCPSQQCPAVMTLSAATKDPPHIKEPPTPPKESNLMGEFSWVSLSSSNDSASASGHGGGQKL